MRFKKGDTIQCTDRAGTDLKANTGYIIVVLDHPYLKVKTDRGTSNWYDGTRFRLKRKCADELSIF